MRGDDTIAHPERILHIRKKLGGQAGALLLKKVGVLFFALVILAAFFAEGSVVLASKHAKTRTVRVAITDFARMIELDNHHQPTGGYAYEYVQTLASYAGWKVEYIYGDSFAKDLEMLLDGEVDLMYDISYTKEREKLILYPEETMGTESYYLYALSNNNTISSDDITTLNGKTVGVTTGTMQIEMLHNWCAEKHIDLNIREYDSIPDKETALFAGEIDLDLELNMLVQDGFSAVEKIGSSEYYLVVNKKQKDILREMNEARRHLDSTEPYYISDLDRKYFGNTIVSRTLSKREKKWIDAHPVITVGYMNAYLPFCDTTEDGSANGIVKDIMPMMLNNINIENDIQVNYVGFDNSDDMLNALKTKKIDLAFPVYGGASYANAHGVVFTSGVIDVELDLAYKGGLSEKKTEQIAVNKKNQMQKIYSLQNFPDAKIIYFDSIKDCLDAVLTGRADSTLLNGYRTESLLRDPKYSSIKYSYVPIPIDLSFAVKKDRTELLTIMNRTINSIDKTAVMTTTYSYANEMNKPSFGILLRENIAAVILTVAVFAVILSALFVTMINSRKLARINAELEQRARVIEQQKGDLEEQGHALAESEHANNIKTSFLSNMSHEIRTPITTILGMNEIIRRDCKEPNIINCSENIRKAGTSLLGIISDILDFTKIEAGKLELSLESYSLTELIGDLYNMVQFQAEEKGLALTFSIDPNLPSGLMGDALRIKQVITNLLTNAIKYTEAGSVTLTISLEAMTEDTATLYVEVSDTGIGIRQEEMEKLFESFERLDTKRTHTIEGVGLGLPISANLMQMMGSSISVKSTYDAGSTFYFYLDQTITDPTPVELADEAPVSHHEDLHAGSFHFVSPEGHILLVDDTPMNIEVIKGLLSPTEIQIDAVYSGAECIEKFSAKPYDLVFLDYRMPHMDGIETLSALKEKEPQKTAETPIISLTASAVQGERERMLNAGFTDYLTKPISISEMENILVKYLPENLVNYIEEETIEPEENPLEGIPAEAFSYPWLDPKEGVEYCGSAFMYLKAIEFFAKTIDEKAELIDKCLSEGDIHLYTITVHALKSTSLSIGMEAFSQRARSLELAGKNEDIEALMHDTPDFLADFREYKKDLEHILEKAEGI